jgi:hypothetical protein
MPDIQVCQQGSQILNKVHMREFLLLCAVSFNSSVLGASVEVCILVFQCVMKMSG